MSKKVFYHRLVESWKRASEELGIKIVFSEEKPIGKKRIEYFAFLPEFGSKAGIYLGIYRENANNLSSALSEWCRAENMRCSFLNPKTYEDYNRQYFIDTLLDWGYFGEKLPDWAKSRHVPWS